MARQIMNVRNSIVIVPKTKPFSLAYRRLVAWSLEVGLVVMGAAIPWGLGHYVLVSEKNSVVISAAEASSTNAEFSSNTLIPLNPVLEKVQQGWARIARIPPHQRYRLVPRWTDILWTAALILPVGVAGGHLVQLSRSGRTWPKRWLGIQVFSMVGGTLMLRQVVARELLRWGVPLGLVGGISLITGASLGVWTPAVVGLLAILEGVSAITSDNRAWHDRIAHTRVAMVGAGLLTQLGTQANGLSANTLSLDRITGNGALSNQAPQLGLYGENPDEDDWWLTESAGNLTSLVLAPRANIVPAHPPGKITLFKSSSSKRWLWWILTSGLLLTGGLGFGVGRATRLSASTQTGEDVFLETAQKLIDSDQEGHTAAILMLAQTDDPRTVYYLADLLSQTNQPKTLATLQQTLISKGLESIPSLSALSRGLTSDLQQPLDEDIRQIRLAQRHAVQGAIAKLLAVHSSELAGMNLDRVDLSLYHDEQRTFQLIQPGLRAAGTSWQSANLNRANLAQASFFDVGPDGIPNSYDDIISELSGVELENASLEEANLQGAQLDRANLRQADLTHANLAYGNLEQTQLINARLMHINATKSRWQGSNLVGADLTQAIFDQADVSQARLSRIDASHSRWIQADLDRSHWVGANLMGADFTQADLTSANFQGANLDGVNFSQANLRQANLRDTDLRHVNLIGATLTDVDLAGAILEDRGSLSGSFITPNAQLNDAQHLQGVNFSRVRNLDNRQLNYICAQGGIHPTCEKALDN